MIVITLTDCPKSLRGDLSKWLLEINTGVFVGKVSARVRDNLWKRVKDSVRNGRATLVYTTNTEQRMDFRLHNSENQIIDFDGLKLVMKPSVSRVRRLEQKRRNFSKAAQFRIAKRKQTHTQHERYEDTEHSTIPSNTSSMSSGCYPADYVVLDLETSGLREKLDEIIEVGMLKVTAGRIIGSYQALIHTKKPIPRPIEKLTGITNEMIAASGENLKEVLAKVESFIGKDCLVGHNIAFDMKFLNHALQKNGRGVITNPHYDTMSLYQEKCDSKKRISLADMTTILGLSQKPTHRALQDCRAVQEAYEVLKKK